MMVFLSRYWPGFQPIPAGSIYTYRDQGNRIATEYVDGTAGRDNIYLGNMLVASFVSSPLSGTPGWQFYASDHLGSPRFATDIGANVVENRKYWPYGEEAPSSPTSQRLQFSTMERDVEGNNYNDHARHHDFNLGRFLSSDKVGGHAGDPQSWNRYAYAGNNPLKYLDPNGHFKKRFWEWLISGGRREITRGRAIEARQRFRNVTVTGPGASRAAERLEKDAFGSRTPDPREILRHDAEEPKRLRRLQPGEPADFNPHYQHEGKKEGHSFYDNAKEFLTPFWYWVIKEGIVQANEAAEEHIIKPATDEPRPEKNIDPDTGEPKACRDRPEGCGPAVHMYR